MLGVNRPLIIAHGSSNEVAIEQAIVFAQSVVREQRLIHFNATIAQILNQKKVEQSMHGTMLPIKNNEREIQ